MRRCNNCGRNESGKPADNKCKTCGSNYDNWKPVATAESRSGDKKGGNES